MKTNAEQHQNQYADSVPSQEIFPYFQLAKYAFQKGLDKEPGVLNNWHVAGDITDNSVTSASDQKGLFSSAGTRQFSEDWCATQRRQLGIKSSIFSAYWFTYRGSDPKYMSVVVIAFACCPLVDTLTNVDYLDPFPNLVASTSEGPSRAFYDHIARIVTDNPLKKIILVGYETGGSLAVEYALKLSAENSKRSIYADTFDHNGLIPEPSEKELSFSGRIRTFLTEPHLLNTGGKFVGSVFCLDAIPDATEKSRDLSPFDTTLLKEDQFFSCLWKKGRHLGPCPDIGADKKKELNRRMLQLHDITSVEARLKKSKELLEISKEKNGYSVGELLASSDETPSLDETSSSSCALGNRWRPVDYLISEVKILEIRLRWI